MPWSLLLEHFAALALIWVCVFVPGFALLPILRLRSGFAAIPLLGCVYWAVVLYLFPFAGGLDVAAAVAVAAASVSMARWWQAGSPRPVWTRPSWSMLILVTGGIPYLTTLLTHYVPFGMDGSMHATAAVVIADARGLPWTYAPFLSELPFPPMNLGLPAVAGVAIRGGGEPAAVMLASHHLTFVLLMLATYLLLRVWVRRTPAALIAVASVWMARGAQASLGWGGFPTVLSVAIGIFAATLILKQARAHHWRLSLVTGAAVAAIPLVHGVGGGTWLYCVGPWASLAALLRSSNRWATLRSLAVTGLAAAACLLVYRGAGSIDVRSGDLEWTQAWQRQALPPTNNAWLGAVNYIRKDAGSLIVLTGWAALGILAVRRQWLAATLLGAAWLALTVVVANTWWWVLPASFLLYPERALYWAAPLSAVGMALVWRTGAADWRVSGWAPATLALLMLTVAAYSQNQFYQKIVREDFVNHDGWAALVWSRENLDPARDFVLAPYNSTGSFLPAVARIGCTGSHNHHFLQRQVQAAYQNRAITHVLVDQALAPQTAVPGGTTVFQKGTIQINRLRTD